MPFLFVPACAGTLNTKPQCCFKELQSFLGSHLSKEFELFARIHRQGTAHFCSAHLVFQSFSGADELHTFFFEHPTLSTSQTLALELEPLNFRQQAYLKHIIVGDRQQSCRWNSPHSARLFHKFSVPVS